jgi:hypothetical protein
VQSVNRDLSSPDRFHNGYFLYLEDQIQQHVFFKIPLGQSLVIFVDQSSDQKELDDVQREQNKHISTSAHGAKRPVKLSDGMLLYQFSLLTPGALQ